MFDGADLRDLKALAMDFPPPGPNEDRQEGQPIQRRKPIEPSEEVLATSPKLWPCLWAAD